MKFGIYVHIPYCLQRCTYCDFATYEKSQILPSEQYIQLLTKELEYKSAAFPHQELDTLYFGGGTPSLLPASQILTVIDALAKNGFAIGPKTEVTIEMNPATVDEQKLDAYLKMGINRFSVGAQTFSDPLLKSVRREHNAEQTRETLRLLASRNLNFSFDLLFALPGHTLEILAQDLQEVRDFAPTHVSPYCLTVPEGHVLSAGRPVEDTQLEMFELIRRELERDGYERYEISNFAKPGFESKHNSLYWTGDAYWGLGLSAHSYLPDHGPYGMRFWNPSAMGSYERMIKGIDRKSNSPNAYLEKEQYEELLAHQALTDFCHISLRRKQGLSLKDVQKKWGAPGVSLVQGPLAEMTDRGWLKSGDASQNFALTEEGLLISNQVFSNLTILQEEWAAATQPLP